MQLKNKETRIKLHNFLIENNFKLFKNDSFTFGRLNYFHSKDDEFEFKHNYLKFIYSLNDYIENSFNIDIKHKKHLFKFVETNIDFFLQDNSSDLFSLLPFKNSLLDLNINKEQKINLILNSKAKEFNIKFFDITLLHSFLYDNLEPTKAKKCLVKFLKKRQNQLVLNDGKLIGDFLISKYSKEDLKDFCFFSNVSNLYNDINLDIFTELPYIVFRTQLDLLKASKKLEELSVMSICLVIDSFNSFYFDRLNLKSNGVLEKNNYTVSVFKYNDEIIDQKLYFNDYMTHLSKFIIQYNSNGLKKDLNKDYLNVYIMNYFINLEVDNSIKTSPNTPIKKNKI